RLEAHTVDRVVTTAVPHLFARPEAGYDVEPLVEHLGANAGASLLAESAELLRDAADTGAEDDAASAQRVQGRHLVCNDVWSATREWRDVRPDDEPLGARGDGGQGDPGIARRMSPDEAEVVPDEQ